MSFPLSGSGSTQISQALPHRPNKTTWFCLLLLLVTHTEKAQGSDWLPELNHRWVSDLGEGCFHPPPDLDVGHLCDSVSLWDPEESPCLSSPSSLLEITQCFQGPYRFSLHRPKNPPLIPLSWPEARAHLPQFTTFLPRFCYAKMNLHSNLWFARSKWDELNDALFMSAETWKWKC